MARLLPFVVLGALGLVEDGSASAEPGTSGLRIGAGSGFSAPVGSTFEGSGELRDSIVGQVPLRLDLGYRITDHVYLGAGVQLGAIVSRGCAPDERCSGTDVRAFVLAAYHLFPDGLVDPWAGVGLGFEILDLTRSAFGSTLELTASGVELFDAELGADVRLGGRLRFGPVVSMTMGRYTSITINGAPAADFDPVLHEWVAFTARAAYDF